MSLFIFLPLPVQATQYPLVLQNIASCSVAYLLLFLEEDRWCTVTLNKQKVKTKEMGVDVVWQDTVSLFVDSIQYDKVCNCRELNADQILLTLFCLIVGGGINWGWIFFQNFIKWGRVIIK